MTSGTPSPLRVIYMSLLSHHFRITWQSGNQTVAAVPNQKMLLCLSSPLQCKTKTKKFVLLQWLRDTIPYEAHASTENFKVFTLFVSGLISKAGECGCVHNAPTPSPPPLRTQQQNINIRYLFLVEEKKNHLQRNTSQHHINNNIDSTLILKSDWWSFHLFFSRILWLIQYTQ